MRKTIDLWPRTPLWTESAKTLCTSDRDSFVSWFHKSPQLKTWFQGKGQLSLCIDRDYFWHLEEWGIPAPRGMGNPSLIFKTKVLKIRDNGWSCHWNVCANVWAHCPSMAFPMVTLLFLLPGLFPQPLHIPYPLLAIKGLAYWLQHLGWEQPSMLWWYLSAPLHPASCVGLEYYFLRAQCVLFLWPLDI